MYENLNIKKVYHESIFNITQIEENLHLIAYSLLAFLMPFLLGHPQIVVGIVVNASLILGATYLKGYKMLPVIMLPSIAVLSRGLIFGPFTVFLIYMIPFIWLSNAMFAYGYKYLALKSHGKNNIDNNIQNKILSKIFSKTISIVLPAIIKSAFLFLAALALVKLGVLPVIFLTTMGLLQLGTALAGGFVALGIIQGFAKMKEISLKK